VESDNVLVFEARAADSFQPSLYVAIPHRVIGEILEGVVPVLETVPAGNRSRFFRVLGTFPR